MGSESDVGRNKSTVQRSVLLLQFADGSVCS